MSKETETNNNTQVVVRRAHPMVEWLDSKRDTILGYCSEGITPEHLSRTLATALLRDPTLTRCTKESVILAVTNAARLGLDPTGERNSAHFIAYNNKEKGVVELKLMIGYGGLIDLIIRNTDIIDIQTEVVFKGEHFKVCGGTDQRVEHDLDFGIRNIRGYDDVIASYAVATFASGYKKAVVLSRMELNKAQAAAKGTNNVWKFSPIEMAKKTPVRNMSKWLSIGPDFNTAIQISDDSDGYNFAPKEESTPDDLRTAIGELIDMPTEIDEPTDDPEPEAGFDGPPALDFNVDEIAAMMDAPKPKGKQ